MSICLPGFVNGGLAGSEVQLAVAAGELSVATAQLRRLRKLVAGWTVVSFISLVLLCLRAYPALCWTSSLIACLLGIACGTFYRCCTGSWDVAHKVRLIQVAAWASVALDLLVLFPIALAGALHGEAVSFLLLMMSQTAAAVVTAQGVTSVWVATFALITLRVVRAVPS
eukprot:evm.model.scf_2358.1 EVM.evm.TU.scf_2358.1   scf_2358:4745-5693(-)